jgi:hypothetical protein
MSVEVFTTVALFEEGKWARLDDLLARRKLRWQRLRMNPGRSLRARARCAGTAIVALTFAVSWIDLSVRGAEASIPTPLALEPLYRATGSNGLAQLVSRSHLEFERLKTNGVAFLAVVTNVWPPDLVPVFAVEKSNRFELRRRPAAGMESSSEPVFFALAPEDEAEAPKVTGRWECRAVRGSGNTDHLAWELTIEGERLAGRFDQTQEYRVATIAGGTFRSNRIELRVEYFMDHYVLKGVWRDDRLSGDWRHVDDSERGSWEATRSPVRLPSGTGVEVVPLYEWRRTGDDALRYATGREKLPGDWRRVGRPLCRVWERVSPGRE